MTVRAKLSGVRYSVARRLRRVTATIKAMRGTGSPYMRYPRLMSGIQIRDTRQHRVSAIEQPPPARRFPSAE